MHIGPRNKRIRQRNHLKTVFSQRSPKIFFSKPVPESSHQNGSFSVLQHMSQLLLLGKFEYSGGPIFKVVLEC